MTRPYVVELRHILFQAELTNPDSVMAAQHTQLLLDSPTAKQRMILSNVQGSFKHGY